MAHLTLCASASTCTATRSGVPARRLASGRSTFARDPRSTLFVFDSQEAGGWRWLALECTVAILDGPDAAELNLGFFKAMQAALTPAPPPGKLSWFGQPKTEKEFLQAMKDEQRLIYEFSIARAYGMYGGVPTG